MTNDAPRRIPLGPEASIGDFRRYPGCRLMITCNLCGWCRTYSVERVIDRLRQKRTGGHATPLGRIARHVAWNCPGCHRVAWRADLAWPPNLTAAEVKRLTNIYRN